MKEELCEKVVELRRRSDRVMTVVMVLEEEAWVIKQKINNEYLGLEYQEL